MQGKLPGWICRVRFFSETDSTNRVAREWASGGADHGSLVVADYQTAGRGRLGRTWWAPAGSSLLFTLILRPALPAGRLGLINLAAAVAVSEALAGRGFRPAVKWPNDVLLSGRKVAGILSEAGGAAVCLGVAVNVNMVEFAPEISGTATSLALESGAEFDRASLLGDVLDHLHELLCDPVARVPDAYRRWSGTLGALVQINLPDRTIRGVAVDIDESGALILDSGEVVAAGDVVHLRP